MTVNPPLYVPSPLHSGHIHFGSPQKLEKFVPKRPKRGVVRCTTASLRRPPRPQHEQVSYFAREEQLIFARPPSSSTSSQPSIFRWWRRVLVKINQSYSSQVLREKRQQCTVSEEIKMLRHRCGALLGLVIIIIWSDGTKHLLCPTFLPESA